MMRIGGRTDRASMTKIFMGSMRPRGAVKSMAFHDPCKPFPLAEASDIYHISRLEEIHVYYLS
jgi:hypothetical protein